MRWRRVCAAFALLATTQPVLSAAESDAFCVEACRSSFGTVQFAGSDPSAPVIAPECNSSLNLQSLYLCVGIHCSRRAGVQGLDDLNQTCSRATGLPIPPFDLVSNYTKEDIKAIPRFNVTNPPRESPVRSAILPADDLVDIWMRTFDVQAYVRWHHWIYGWAMGVFWAGVVAVGMVNHLVSHFEARKKRWFSNQSLYWGWMKHTVFTPATFGRRCAQDYGGWCTVPPFVQTLTIAVFVLLNIVCCARGYKIFPGHMYFPSETKQVLRHLSDRTGIISFANFPIIWLFGMRNNVVLWLTGWDFGTYNNFHRWVARVATLQAVIHSIGYTVMIFQEGGWEYFAWWWTFLFWWAGELATIFMCALLAFSVYWLRRQQYEIFLLIHIGLSVLVLITMLGHVSIFDGEYNALVWVPALIWLADRVVRLARVLAFNRRLSTAAHATFNAATNMIRLEIPVSSSIYTVRPGTFFYLTMPDDANFWESHPFTVASASKSGLTALEMAGEADPLLEGHQSPEPVQQDVVSSDADFMSFLIRPYDSFTSRLRDLADAQWPKPAPVRIIVDGPYGNTLPLNVFDHVVFVVGGSGIVVPLTYAQTLTTSSTRPRSVHVHWAAREAALVTELLERDLREALDCENFHLHVYLTASDGHTLGDGTNHQFNCARQRINVAAVVEEAVVDAADSSIAVVACGPAQMADEARRAAVHGMKTSAGRVDYFEESFQW